MVKKLSINELRIGMYVERIEGSWLDHPFFFSRRKVKSQKEINKLAEAGIRHVEVDMERSSILDQNESTSNPEITTPEPVRSSQQKPSKEATEIESPPLSQMEKAKVLYSGTIEFAKKMMDDVRNGRPLDYRKALPLVNGIIHTISRDASVLFSVLSSLRTYNEYTYTHSVNVAILAVLFGSFLSILRDELIILGVGGLFHDVGKAKIPAEILNKPGKLEEWEFNVVKKHPEEGYRSMRGRADMPPDILRIILEHHERYDGHGYPHGLRHSAINKKANMVGVVDVYDALTSDRVYRKAMLPFQALQIMYAQRQKDYYPGFIESFIQCLGVFPVASVEDSFRAKHEIL